MSSFKKIERLHRLFQDLGLKNHQEYDICSQVPDPRDLYIRLWNHTKKTADLLIVNIKGKEIEQIEKEVLLWLIKDIF